MEEIIECTGYIAAHQSPGLLMIAGIDEVLPKIKELIVVKNERKLHRFKVFIKIVCEEQK